MIQPASRPIGESDRERRIKVTVEAWSYMWSYKGKARTLTCPVGTVWDGMSVPRWAVSFCGLYPGGMSDGPSLAHDTLYRAAGGAKPEAWNGSIITGDTSLVSRAESDWVLHMAMIDAGFSQYRAWVARAAVRVGGRKHWGGPTPETN